MAKEVPLKRGKVLRRNVKGRTQIAKRRNRAITNEEKEIFLGHLSGCCNISAAAAAAKRSVDGFNRIRNRDAEFARLCHEAIETGHTTIEALMLERARLALEEQKNDPLGAVGEAARQKGEAYALSLNGDQILRLLAYHRRTVNGGPRRAGPLPGPAASEDEACAAILKKLAVLRKRIDAKKA